MVGWLVGGGGDMFLACACLGAHMGGSLGLYVHLLGSVDLSVDRSQLEGVS